MDTLSDLPEPETPEEAVIAHYRLSGNEYGSHDERQAILDAERTMATAVEETGVGEVDENEFGGGEVVVYAYGADAGVHFQVMEPILRGLPFRPAHVVLRQGRRRRRPEWTCDAVQQRSTATPATASTQHRPPHSAPQPV
ncbi:hypothetical protein ACWGH3_08780 [Streptomyces sp. NPDC054884]